MSLFPGKRFWPKHVTEQRGSVLALVVFFLPVAVVATGMVVDLGIMFCARKAVQAACDLGALAGVQMLDWDSLSEGVVMVEEASAEAVAKQVAAENLQSCQALFAETTIWATAKNPPQCLEPCVTVEARYKPGTYFLRFLPGFSQGVAMTWLSEAAVVERTVW